MKLDHGRQILARNHPRNFTPNTYTRCTICENRSTLPADSQIMAQTEGITAFPSAKGATPSQPSPTGWVRDRSEGQRAEGPTYPPPIPNPSFTNQNRREPWILTHGKAQRITRPLVPDICHKARSECCPIPKRQRRDAITAQPNGLGPGANVEQRLKARSIARQFQNHF